MHHIIGSIDDLLKASLFLSFPSILSLSIPSSIPGNRAGKTRAIYATQHPAPVGLDLQ